MALMKKLKKVLADRFPPPDKFWLEDHDGIVGAVISTRFARMDGVDRYNYVRKILEAHLTLEERRGIQFIVAVTPDEEVAYSCGADD